MSEQDERELRAEIHELRGELGETAEQLAHKVNVPARTKERAAELRDQAKDVATELRDQAKERASTLRHQARERAIDLRHQATDIADRAKVTAQETPPSRWATVAAIGAGVIALIVGMRAVRAR